jgi:hypothetical protein
MRQIGLCIRSDPCEGSGDVLCMRSIKLLCPLYLFLF